jgi:glutamate carboxypeptidase
MNVRLSALSLARWGALASLFLLPSWSGPALGAAVEPVWSLVGKERPAFLKTLQSLVEIESGSADREGLDRISDLIGKRLRELGAKVELIEPGAEIYKMFDTPEKIGRMVRGTFTGTGTKKILLIAHMDTVYPRGMLAGQPFEVKGDRVYGLGIADDKHGITIILHALGILKAIDYRSYGRLTVLINGDEEVSSPASRFVITKAGGEHDVVLSFEGSTVETDQVRLATSGIAAATINVRGRGSHAGSAPERGVNALYELSHQVLQARDLSKPKEGLQVNWTLAKAGIVRNMIPPGAQAQADIRVDRVSDYDGVEKALQERIKNKLLPETEVTLEFERRRPPLQTTDASRALAKHAQQVYSEIGKKLTVRDRPTGGGTDAAFAALNTKAPVIEGFGLQGFGAHSTNAEYVLLDSIEPRLYLAIRMIMDLSEGKAGQ